MFCTRSGWFRDFSSFSSFLVLFSSLLQSGYVQQSQGTPTPPPGSVQVALAKVNPVSKLSNLPIQPANSIPLRTAAKLAAAIGHPEAPLQLTGPDDPTDSYIVSQ